MNLVEVLGCFLTGLVIGRDWLPCSSCLPFVLPHCRSTTAAALTPSCPSLCARCRKVLLAKTRVWSPWDPGRYVMVFSRDPEHIARSCVDLVPQKSPWGLTESPVEKLKQPWVATQICVMYLFL